jgi:hypothetical protein
MQRPRARDQGGGFAHALESYIYYGISCGGSFVGIVIGAAAKFRASSRAFESSMEVHRARF